MPFRKTTDEQDLVQRLLARDEHALGLLAARYGGSLLSVIVRVVRDREPAEDLLQEELLKVWTSIASYDAEQGTAVYVDGAGILQPSLRRAAQPAPPLPPQHEAAGGLRDEPGSGTGVLQPGALACTS